MGRPLRARSAASAATLSDFTRFQPEEQVQTILVPRGEPPQERSASIRPSTPPPTEPPDPSLGRFRVSTELVEATVAATGEPATVVLQVSNTSSIVDGYVVEIPGAPS